MTEYEKRLLSFILLFTTGFAELIADGADYCDRRLRWIETGNGQRRDRKSWEKMHREHLQKSNQLASELQFVIYGDSITQDLAKMNDVMDIYRKVYETEAFGISGDKSENLLYRLKTGEFSEGSSPHFAVLLVGINDILHWSDGLSSESVDMWQLVDQVKNNIRDMAALIHQRSCMTQVLVQALLPTAWEGENIWPNRYTLAIQATNFALEKLAEQHDNLHYVDCSAGFLQGPLDDQAMINLELMEDLLHPTKVGHEAMARCLLRRAQQVTEYIAANHVEVRFAAWEACSQPCGGGWQSREWQCIVGADFLLGLNSDLQREASSTVCSSVKVGDAQLSRICNTETCRPATQVTSRVEHDREQPGQQDPPPESQQPTNRRDGPLAPASPVQQPKQPSLPKQTDNSSRSVPVPKTEQLPPPFESVEQQQQELTRPQDTSPRPRGSAPLTQPPPIRVIEPSETTDAGSSQVADRQKQESMTPAAAREVVPSSDKTSDFPNEDTARETSMRQSTGSNIPSLQPGPPSNVAQPVEPGGRSAQEKHKRTDASPSVDEDEAIDPSAIEALPMTAEEQLPGQDEVHVPEYSMFEGVDGARNEDVRSSQEKHKRTGASPSVDEDEAIDPSANEASPMMAEEQLPGQDEVHVPEYSLLEGVDGARNEAVGETGEHSGSEEESRPPRKAVDSRPLADSQFPSMTTAADASISADRPLAFAVWILIGVLFVTALVSLAGLLYYILNNRRVGVRQYPANKRGAPTEKDNDVQEQVQKGVFDLSTMTREAEFSGDLVRDSIVAVRDSFDCYMLPMPPRTSLSASFHPMILRASFQEHP